MISFLDFINQALSYFNIKPKLKNRIYTIIALLGDGYLIYVTVRLFMNHAWTRAVLYCLVVIFLTYYLYLNLVYYYLGRTSKLDFLSPWLSKITGTETDSKTGKHVRHGRQDQFANNMSNGYFTNENVIQATVKISKPEQNNLRDLVDNLVANGVFFAEYHGLDNEGIVAQYQETGEPVSALNDQQTPPYFELIHQRGRLEIFAGVNQMERVPIGHITKVGLTDVSKATDDYRLYLANLYVTGGPNKIPGRNGSTILRDGDFGLVALVAYKEREEQDLAEPQLRELEAQEEQTRRGRQRRSDTTTSTTTPSRTRSRRRQ